MKRLLIVALVALASIQATAQPIGHTKCQTTPSGGFCCWDTDVEGPWRPVDCG